jgi:hypothetical protein
MGALRTSETSVHSNETTRRCIPEDSKLHTRLRENLKSHSYNLFARLGSIIELIFGLIDYIFENYDAHKKVLRNRK